MNAHENDGVYTLLAGPSHDRSKETATVIPWRDFDELNKVSHRQTTTRTASQRSQPLRDGRRVPQCWQGSEHINTLTVKVTGAILHLRTAVAVAPSSTGTTIQQVEVEARSL